MGRDTCIWIGGENCRMFEGQNLACEITQVLLAPFNLHLDKDKPIFGI